MKYRSLFAASLPPGLQTNVSMGHYEAGRMTFIRSALPAK
jgi:hypothetical protein